VVNSRIQGCRFPDRIPPPHCDYITSGDNEILDKAIGFEWENPGSMNTSFGFNQNDHNWVDAKEIVFRLVDIVSKGGNYLLNVGPTAEGLIPQPCIDRLMEVGTWMETNGEAIYGTLPWKVLDDGSPLDKEADQVPGGSPRASVDVRFTAKANSVYVICLSWPEREVRVRPLGRRATPNQTIVAARMLGSSDEVKWQQNDDALTLSVPREKPCRHAFVYRIDHKRE
jgi:alpha-L-fucosidase